MTVSITSNHNKNIGDRQSGNLAHNRRSINPHNVDKRLIFENIVFKSEKLSMAYERAFGDAIDEYNAGQKRKDRIKFDRHSYFEHLFGVSPESDSAQTILTSNSRGKHEIKSFNEDIFQVGDCGDFGHFMRDKNGNFIDKNGNPMRWNKSDNTYYNVDGIAVNDSSFLMRNPNAETAKEILCAFYLGGRFRKVCDNHGKSLLKRVDEDEIERDDDIVIKSFEERNPNFHVVFAAVHNDEWHGTPHIHIDYIPVGTGYVKGPKKQVGFERALANMGYENKQTAFVEWREKERAMLKKICGYFGLETKTREEERENNRGITYSTDVYRQAIREGNFDAQTVRNDAEQYANALRISACRESKEMRELADLDARRIVENASRENEVLQGKNRLLSEENSSLLNTIEQNRSRIVLLTEVADKMPKKKIFGEKVYLNRAQYEEYLLVGEKIRQYSQNALASEEDKKAAENEKKRLEKLRRDAEMLIKRQAEQLAEQTMRETREELAEKTLEYEELIKKEKGLIFGKAMKIAEKASASFKQLDWDKKKEHLINAYKEEQISRIADRGDDLTLD